MSAPAIDRDPPTVNPDQRGAPTAWRGPIMPVNTESGDGRVYTLDDGADIDVRPLPLPLCAQDEIAEGHDGGRVVGRIDRLWVQDGAVWGEGVFDEHDPNAMQWARRLADGHAGWVSADMDRTQYTQIARDVDGNEVAPEKIATGAVEEGTPLLRVSRWRIMGATLVAHPAFAEAKIAPAESEPVVEPVTAALTAAGVVYDVADFTMPEADGPTAITVTADGHVFGHLCLWNTCHIGYAGSCVTPPRSPSGYDYFHQGVVATTQGDVPVGKLTLGTGHAGLDADSHRAAAHYDNSGTAVAVVRAVDGDHGVWFSGRVLPAVGDDRVEEMRRCGVSGDWRSIGGALELVAALCVNTPGFPVPRTESLAAGGQLALVAAGVVANAIEGGTRQPCTAPSDSSAEPDNAQAEQSALIASLEARMFAPDLAALDARIQAARLADLDGRMHATQLARLDARVRAADVNPADDHKAKPLERYWTLGKGLARWAGSPTPYRTLVAELTREIGPGMRPDQIKGLAAVYFHKVRGYWPGHRKGDNPVGPGALAAAGASGDHDDDAMIALVPSAGDAARLAVPGGEPQEELHCTIAYYPDAEVLPSPEAIAAAFDSVTGPIVGELSGTAVFAGQHPCSVYLVQAEGLTAMHAALAPEGGTFDAYVPHITAVYNDPGARLPEGGPVTFDRIRLSIRGEQSDFSLAEMSGVESVLVAAYNPDQPRNPMGHKGGGRFTDWISQVYPNLTRIKHDARPKKQGRGVPTYKELDDEGLLAMNDPFEHCRNEHERKVLGEMRDAGLAVVSIRERTGEAGGAKTPDTANVAKNTTLEVKRLDPQDPQRIQQYGPDAPFNATSVRRKIAEATYQSRSVLVDGRGVQFADGAPQHGVRAFLDGPGSHYVDSITVLLDEGGIQWRRG